MRTSSLQRAAIDPGRILSEARMIHGASKRCTVVVEGDADFRFFGQWIDRDAACLKSVNGKTSVKSIWKEAKKRNFHSLICVTDLDYDAILGTSPIQDECFLYISFDPTTVEKGGDCNDLESALIKSQALDKFLMQRLPINLVTDDIGFASCVSSIREKLRVAASKFGAYRAAGQAFYFEHRRSPLGDFYLTDDFFNADKLELDKEELKKILMRSSYTTKSDMEEVMERADRYFSKHRAGWGLCRGHDMCEMLAQHLTTIVSRRINPLEVESGLREAFETRMMEGAKFWNGLKVLQTKFERQLFRL